MIAQVWFVLAMLLVVVLARGVGERIGIPFTILLSLAGLLYTTLPGPDVHLEPEVVLVLVLPPLLYGTARRSSLLAIRAHLRPIVSLSVLLVLVTAFAVGILLTHVILDMPLAVAMALGAAVAPPDPVAALSIGRRAGMPPRLTVLIEGEGLLNDATALTIYQVAVAAAVGGGFSWGAASGRFALAVTGGLVVGVLVALTIRAVRRWLHDPLIANAVSLAVPFVAYLLAEQIHSSGVLAVVIAGLMVGHDAGREETGASRLQTAAVWQFVEFLLEGFVFLLIGQQLPDIVQVLRTEPTGEVVTAAAVTVGAVLLVRPMWLVVTQVVPAWFRAGLGTHSDQRLSWRELIALSWAGSRGVITLAAVFAVPLAAQEGLPFPKRDVLLFCAYAVVLVTLVGQGLTFAPLLRRLDLRVDKAETEHIRNQARLAAVDAAMSTVDDLLGRERIGPELADSLRASLSARADRFRARSEALTVSESGEEINWPLDYQAAASARRAIIDAQREELRRWRDDRRLSDTGLRVLRKELDHEERFLLDL